MQLDILAKSDLNSWIEPIRLKTHHHKTLTVH